MNGNGIAKWYERRADTNRQSWTLVLPKDVRDELAINPGDLLKISIHGDEVTLRPSREASGFIKRVHTLVFSSGNADLLDNETVEAIRRLLAILRFSCVFCVWPLRR